MNSVFFERDEGMGWTRHLAMRFAAAVLVTACGGGGGGSSEVPAPAPPSLELLAGMPGSAGLVDGMRADARFLDVQSIAAAPDGTLYAIDSNNGVVRRITADGKVDTPIQFGRGFLQAAIATDDSGAVYVGKRGFCARGGCEGTAFEKIAVDGSRSDIPVVGSSDGSDVPGVPLAVDAIAVDAAGNMYIADGSKIHRLTRQGDLTLFEGAAGSMAGDLHLTGPLAIAIDRQGQLVVVDAGSQSARRMTPEGGVSIIATGALAPAPTFASTRAVALAANGAVLVSDPVRHVIYSVAPDGAIATLAGASGRDQFVPGPLPGSLNGPYGIALARNDLYIAMGTAIAVIRNLQ